VLLLALVAVPLAFGLLAAALPSERWRPCLVPAGGAVHLGLTALAVRAPATSALGGWLAIDTLTRLILPLLSLLFFVCACYAPGYLSQRAERPNRLFCTGLLIFLGMMTLITESHHLGLMWVALELNTLASAPLLYFNHNARSLEATWKYVMIGAVGIALALLGSFFLAYAALSAGLDTSLLFDDLVGQAPLLSRPWLHSAFVLLFVGYGTKMGLAPMHTWKPDAYGEAPGLVGALLAGGLTTCAFVALLRFYQILSAAGEAEFASDLLIAAGLLSMALAGVFMARQRDFKRMLAYSSVEHMGILVLGVGVGGLGTFGALLHVVNNALAKGVMFLSAANIHRAFGSKTTDRVSGALRRVPVSAALFLAGFFAVTGSPPFGPFVSEFTILGAAIGQGHPWVGTIMVLLLAIIFVGMARPILDMLHGEQAPGPGKGPRVGGLRLVGPVVLIMLVLLLGVYLPLRLRDVLAQAAVSLGGKLP
jgi:hydrogenase-4 component F